MSLYQKYRPQKFSEIQGQEHVRKVIQAALQKEMVSHAYLFTGPRGTGKTTIARLLARSLMCEQQDKDGDPCGQCTYCQEISKGRILDLVEMDAASHTGVDDMRELIEKAQFAPTFARKKIYIIDEVHMLSKSAFNALLKTLEEPPEHVHFILATTEVDKVPETILSRCQRFDFQRIAIEDIVKKLEFICKEEKVKCKKTVLEMVADRADGALRNAEVLLEQLISENALTEKEAAKSLGVIGVTVVRIFLDLLEKQDWVGAMANVSEIHNSGQNLKNFTREVLRKLQQDLISQAGDLSQLSHISRLIEIFLRASDQFKRALIPELPLEIAIAEIALLDHDLSGNKNTETKLDFKISSPSTIKEKKTASLPSKIEKQNISEEIKTKKNDLTKIHDLKTNEFKSLWIELLNSPQLAAGTRNSLKTAVPRDFTGDRLLLVLHSDFHHGQLSRADITTKIEEVMTKIWGGKINIEWLLEPKVVDSKEEIEMISRSFTSPKSTKENVEEIFGG